MDRRALGGELGSGARRHRRDLLLHPRGLLLCRGGGGLKRGAELHDHLIVLGVDLGVIALSRAVELARGVLGRLQRGVGHRFALRPELLSRLLGDPLGGLALRVGALGVTRAAEVSELKRLGRALLAAHARPLRLTRSQREHPRAGRLDQRVGVGVARGPVSLGGGELPRLRRRELGDAACDRRVDLGLDLNGGRLDLRGLRVEHGVDRRPRGQDRRLHGADERARMGGDRRLYPARFGRGALMHRVARGLDITRALGSGARGPREGRWRRRRQRRARVEGRERRLDRRERGRRRLRGRGGRGGRRGHRQSVSRRLFGWSAAALSFARGRRSPVHLGLPRRLVDFGVRRGASALGFRALVLAVLIVSVDSALVDRPLIVRLGGLLVLPRRPCRQMRRSCGHRRGPRRIIQEPIPHEPCVLSP